MKLTNYIMEQDISPISIDDIEITRLFAEMDVASSLIDCYAKHALICEYSTCDPSEFGVFVEAHMDALPGELSTNKAEKAAKVRKGFGATLKKWWTAFINLIKRIIGGIKKTFSATTIKTLIEMVEAAPDGTEYEIPAKEGNSNKDIQTIALDYLNIVEKYNTFADVITNSQYITADNVGDLSYNKLGTQSIAGYNKFGATSRLNVASGGKISKAGMLAVLHELDEAGVVPKANEMLKSLDAIEKTNVVALTSLDSDSDAQNDANAAQASVIQALKDTANKLSKEFNSISVKLIAVQKAIIKTGNRAAKKVEKSAAKAVNEYYTDEDDVIQEMTSGSKKGVGALVGTLIGGLPVGTLIGYFIGKSVAKKNVGNEICQRIDDVRLAFSANETDLKMAVNRVAKSLKELSKEISFATKSAKQYTGAEKEELNNLRICTEKLRGDLGESDPNVIKADIEEFVETANKVYKFCSYK